MEQQTKANTALILPLQEKTLITLEFWYNECLSMNGIIGTQRYSEGHRRDTFIKVKQMTYLIFWKGHMTEKHYAGLVSGGRTFYSYNTMKWL